LVGKEAPAFTLDLLGGGKLDLAEHKGKHVVILDFWASWCGPCRKAMPVYAKIAEEYKEKGVAFYAVNLAESAETARGFLEKVGVQCAVALDADGNVGKKYGAASIPMSVIIGKDGIVTHVHAGFSDALAAQLKQELDVLLKGGEPSGAEALRAPRAPATAP
jgi:thiol-disulfide isomerase/thioredoxin